jgi:hypothetical protein
MATVHIRVSGVVALAAASRYLKIAEIACDTARGVAVSLLG